MGTAQYLAPEQATGQTATGASDIYALGVIGYECLTGHRPFSGESQIAIALAQVNDAPPPLPETLPKPVRALLMSMLAKDPKNRPENAIKLSEAAEAIRNGDVDAAHAAVPGMLLFEATTGPITAPVDIATAPTGVIARKDSSTTSTSALPVLGAAAGAATGAGSTLSRADALAAERSWVQEEETYDDEPADEPDRHGRSPWTWPLIALIVLVLFALVGFFLTQMGVFSPAKDTVTSSAASSPPSTSASPATTSASATPTPSRTSATPTPTPTPTTVDIISAAYLGKDYHQVQGTLETMGLSVTLIPQQSTATAGTVLQVSPSGTVPKGTDINVTYAVPVPAPSPSPTASSPAAAATLPICNPGQLPGPGPTCKP
jgi:serine/threonine-protein kinase